MRFDRSSVDLDARHLGQQFVGTGILRHLVRPGVIDDRIALLGRAHRYRLHDGLAQLLHVGLHRKPTELHLFFVDLHRRGIGLHPQIGHFQQVIPESESRKRELSRNRRRGIRLLVGLVGRRTLHDSPDHRLARRPVDQLPRNDARALGLSERRIGQGPRPKRHDTTYQRYSEFHNLFSVTINRLQRKPIFLSIRLLHR